MNNKEIKDRIDKIINNLNKQKQLIKQLKAITEGKPYIEDGKEIRLIKTRRNK